MIRKVIRVTWVDSESTVGWSDLEGLNALKVESIVGVGILHEVTDHHIKIVQHYSETDDQIYGGFVIPRKAVLEYEVIAEIEVTDRS